MDRWEIVVKVKPDLGDVGIEKMQAELDRHGAAGLGLVSAVQHPVRGIQLYFKSVWRGRRAQRPWLRRRSR